MNGNFSTFQKYIAFKNISFYYSFSKNTANPFAISMDSPSVTINVTKQREKATF